MIVSEAKESLAHAKEPYKRGNSPRVGGSERSRYGAMIICWQKRSPDLLESQTHRWQALFAKNMQWRVPDARRYALLSLA
jgi:hypothetical protein